MASTTLAVRMAWEPQRTLGYASITSSYVAVGTGNLNPERLYILQNQTDANLVFSFDGGVTDHLTLIAGSAFTGDITANKTIEEGAFLSKGIVTYVKAESSLPSSGVVYLSALYGIN